MYTNTKCPRLVDYYFVISCTERGKETIKQRLKGHSLADSSDKNSKPKFAQFALKPSIVDRYPSKPYADTPLLPWVGRAAMPRGVRPRTKPPPPKYVTFTGWNTDGSKLYGACLEVYERIDCRNQKQTVYIPKTLGFLSHYAYFYAFDVFLRCLWHVIPKKLIRLEDLLMHYFYDIPAPQPAKKIAYDLGRMKVLLACRNEFDVPIMELPIEIPFTQLSKDRISMIYKLLLLENRVIFISSMHSVLTPVCELFVNLLFPLRWQHLFLPIVNKTQCLGLRDYKAPFLIGLPRFVYSMPRIQDAISKMDTYLVFLDRNEICDGKQQPIPASIVPQFPSPLEEALGDSVFKLGHILTLPDNSVSRDVTLNAFRTTFAVLTKLLFVAKNERVFPDEEFCIHFRRTQLYKSFALYYNELTSYEPKSLQSPFSPRAAQIGRKKQGLHASQHSSNSFQSNRSPRSSRSPNASRRSNQGSRTPTTSSPNAKNGRSPGSRHKSSNSSNNTSNQDRAAQEKALWQDETFENIYKFFKNHEALGKHFARKQQTQSFAKGFDRSQYKPYAFRINQDIIKRCEKNSAKKRADVIGLASGPSSSSGGASGAAGGGSGASGAGGNSGFFKKMTKGKGDGANAANAVNGIVNGSNAFPSHFKAFPWNAEVREYMSKYVFSVTEHVYDPNSISNNNNNSATGGNGPNAAGSERLGPSGLKKMLGNKLSSKFLEFMPSSLNLGGTAAVADSPAALFPHQVKKHRRGRSRLYNNGRNVKSRGSSARHKNRGGRHFKSLTVLNNSNSAGGVENTESFLQSLKNSLTNNNLSVGAGSSAAAARRHTFDSEGEFRRIRKQTITTEHLIERFIVDVRTDGNEALKLAKIEKTEKMIVNDDLAKLALIEGLQKDKASLAALTKIFENVGASQTSSRFRQVSDIVNGLNTAVDLNKILPNYQLIRKDRNIIKNAANLDSGIEEVDSNTNEAFDSNSNSNSGRPNLNISLNTNSAPGDDTNQTNPSAPGSATASGGSGGSTSGLSKRQSFKEMAKALIARPRHKRNSSSIGSAGSLANASAGGGPTHRTKASLTNIDEMGLNDVNSAHSNSSHSSSGPHGSHGTHKKHKKKPSIISIAPNVNTPTIFEQDEKLSDDAGSNSNLSSARATPVPQDATSGMASNRSNRSQGSGTKKKIISLNAPDADDMDASGVSGSEGSETEAEDESDASTVESETFSSDWLSSDEMEFKSDDESDGSDGMKRLSSGSDTESDSDENDSDDVKSMEKNGASAAAAAAQKKRKSVKKKGKNGSNVASPKVSNAEERNGGASGSSSNDDDSKSNTPIGVENGGKSGKMLNKGAKGAKGSAGKDANEGNKEQGKKGKKGKKKGPKMHRRDSVTGARRAGRFMHLNEFELKAEATRRFIQSQEAHNNLLGGEDSNDPTADVGIDLFSPGILRAFFASVKSRKRTMNSPAKK